MERRYCKHLVNGGSVVRRRECKNRAMAGSEYCSLHVNHPERRIEATKAACTITWTQRSAAWAAS